MQRLTSPLLALRRRPSWALQIAVHRRPPVVFTGRVTPTMLVMRRMCTAKPPGGPQTTGANETAEQTAERLKNPVLWGVCAVLATFAASYLAVPLYKIFCTATGDTLKVQEESIAKLKGMRPPEDRESRVITVNFDAGTNEKMQWGFRPCQRAIKVIPGKSSLAFYNATNKTDRPIVGIATYNVMPVAAGLYFNKIQCFCFEEQLLKAGEDVDMPVFFYLDPELYNDRNMDGVRNITLSYTFFEASDSEGIQASIAAGSELTLKDYPKEWKPKPAMSPYSGELGEKQQQQLR